jgi:hypothetical protein
MLSSRPGSNEERAAARLPHCTPANQTPGVERRIRPGRSLPDSWSAAPDARGATSFALTGLSNELPFGKPRALEDAPLGLVALGYRKADGGPGLGGKITPETWLKAALR